MVISLRSSTVKYVIGCLKTMTFTKQRTKTINSTNRTVQKLGQIHLQQVLKKLTKLSH